MRSEAVDAPGSGAAGEHAAATAAANAVANAVASATPASGVGGKVTAVSVSAAASTPIDVVMARRGGGSTRERPEQRREEALVAAAQVTQAQNEQRRQRHWRRMVHRELRDGLVNGMLEELQRISGDDADVRHLRMCASRYESFVWKKSASQLQYKEKLERRIESLRRQPSQAESGATDTSASMASGFGLDAYPDSAVSPDASSEAHAAAVAAELAPRHHRRQIQEASRDAACTLLATPHLHGSRRASTRKAKAGGNGKRPAKRQKRSSSVSSAGSASSRSSSSPPSLAPTARDEQYFAKLREMKTQYRDEVALVFRELCRVNTVIQHSASLRRHESNNLGDFLANLKKIIYLLEQQPGEMGGMIPARKRTVAYLGVVESHIQRKVLPILHRLRHTYSTILRPIVLNYMRNSYRFSRRL